MKKLFIYSIIFIATLSLAGCSIVPSTAKMMDDTKGFNLPKQGEAGSVLIYIVRPSGVGGVIRFNAFLDDKNDSSEMGYTRGGQHIYFYTTPGKHTVFSKAENWADIDINATDGETIFLKQNPSMGVIMARNSLELITEIEGKYHVKNTEIGEIIKTRAAKEKDK